MAMITYWDSSAIVAASIDRPVRERLSQPNQCTRSHTLAEVFSILTGGRLGYRVDADDAQEILADMSKHLSFSDLTSDEVLSALGEARKKGIRGGQVHDYLHAVAALKANASVFLTLNTSDFKGIFEQLELKEP
jgi:hypothetical protein